MTIPKRYAKIAADFVQVASVAGISIPLSDIKVKFIPNPRLPPKSLPPGTLAIYVFMLGERCLKVGKAGRKSGPRFCGQHYGTGLARSSLAKSFVKGQTVIGLTGLDETNVKAWICQHTSRVHFLIPSKYDVFTLSLLEAFVQCRLRPEFEGFASQRV